jgi:hypothetical protein
MLKRLVLGGLAAWAAVGFLQEVNGAVAGRDGRGREDGGLPWRFGAREPTALADTVEAARADLPRGAAVAFAAGDDPPGSRLVAWRWAAYLLPDRDVLMIDDPAAARLATNVIAFRTEIRDPRLETVRRLPDGWLYLVKTKVKRP